MELKGIVLSQAQKQADLTEAASRTVVTRAWEELVRGKERLVNGVSSDRISS